MAGVNRGTSYHIVTELEKKNFLKSTRRNDVKSYIAQPVDNIIKYLDEQEKEIHSKQVLLKQTLNEFHDLVNTEEQLNEIDFFYGKDAVLNFYKSMPWGDYHYCIFSAESYDKIFPPDTYYGTCSIDVLKGIKGRVLISKTNHPAHQACCEAIDNIIPELTYRVFDNGLIYTDTMIFPNKFVAIINLNENNLHGVRITCKSLIESYSRIFEEVWEKSAKKKI